MRMSDSKCSARFAVLVSVVLAGCVNHSVKVIPLTGQQSLETARAIAMQAAANNGYRLESQGGGEMNFVRDFSSTKYRVRIAVGGIKDLGNKSGVLVECDSHSEKEELGESLTNFVPRVDCNAIRKEIEKNLGSHRN